MSRTRNLTVRLDRDLIRKIEEEAEKESTDKSSIARKLIAVGIRETRRARALEEYRKGKCTLWRAASMAGISLREMLDLIRLERIPLHLSPDDVDQAWREAFGER